MRNKQIKWSQENEVWIDVIVDLFKQLFGEDFLDYVYTTARGTVVAEHSHPREHFFYDHDQWEASFNAASQARSIQKPTSSADALKQLACGRNSNPQTVSSELHGITPLESDQCLQIQTIQYRRNRV